MDTVQPDWATSLWTVYSARCKPANPPTREDWMVGATYPVLSMNYQDVGRIDVYQGVTLTSAEVDWYVQHSGTDSFDAVLGNQDPVPGLTNRDFFNYQDLSQPGRLPFGTVLQYQYLDLQQQSQLFFVVEDCYWHGPCVVVIGN